MGPDEGPGSGGRRRGGGHPGCEWLGWVDPRLTEPHAATGARLRDVRIHDAGPSGGPGTRGQHPRRVALTQLHQAAGCPRCERRTTRRPHMPQRTDRGPWRRRRGLPVAATAVMLVGLVAAACSSTGSGPGGSGTGGPDAHALQRTARADHQRPDRRVHQGRPGSRSGSTDDDEDVSPPRSSRRATALRPTSSTPRTRTGSSSSTIGACWPRSTPSTARQRAASRQRQQRRVGGRVRPCQRHGRTTRARSALPSCPTSVMQLADPQWKDKIEIAPAETDFWPIVSSIARARGQRPRRWRGSRA